MNDSVENVNFLFCDTQRKNLKDFNNMSPSLKTITENYDVKKSSLKGFVQIHEKKENGESELVRESNNLIVYPGRALMLCRAFGKDLDWSNNTQLNTYANLSDAFVSWFAVGTGGAATENNQNPLIVNSTDYGLGGDGSTHGSLTGASKLITVNDKQYMGFDDDYPKFIAEPEIINNEDITNSIRNVSISLNGATSYYRDSYLIANVQVTLEAGAANGTGSQEISECGLFLAPKTYEQDVVDSTWRTAATYDDNGVTKVGYGSSLRDLELFARVTFPTITKNSSRSFTISWYIFF